MAVEGTVTGDTSVLTDMGSETPQCLGNTDVAEGDPRTVPERIGLDRELEVGKGAAVGAGRGQEAMACTALVVWNGANSPENRSRLHERYR